MALCYPSVALASTGPGPALALAPTLPCPKPLRCHIPALTLVLPCFWPCPGPSLGPVMSLAVTLPLGFFFPAHDPAPVLVLPWPSPDWVLHYLGPALPKPANAGALPWPWY